MTLFGLRESSATKFNNGLNLALGASAFKLSAEINKLIICEQGNPRKIKVKSGDPSPP
nr:hypothetical protein [Desulfobulbaceae bacterium]